MKIRVDCRGESVEVQAAPGARLLEYLQQASVPVNAACGGKGTCHKCRVKVQAGFLGVTATDRRAFRESELTEGWRLSCQAMPRTNLEILLPNTESLRSKPRVIRNEKALASLSPSSELVLVCDLGSTGVVVAIAERGAREPLIESHLLNKQVPYGSDVMTRLHSAQKLGIEPLRKAVHQTLESCLGALAAAEPGLQDRVAGMPLFCAGNSAMASILHGWSIDSLAVSPFQPEKREPGRSSLPDGRTVETLPLLAGFVGGDTVAGILALEKREAARPWMLVDIGTNTEIVLNNGRGEYWLSSAPAGPAFEGGNIHHGMRAETGAISSAVVEAGQWKLQTIGNDLARGICGSGLMDILAQAVRHGLIHRDGFVPEGKLQITDQVMLLADDVREFQLAKAATRTAVELLIGRAGIRPQKIYLAGTFAQHLDLDSVRGVGLLPPEVSCEAIGNASLEGTLIWASMAETERRAFLAGLEKERRPVELALQDDFQDRFVAQLDFPAPWG
jgi:uncharacterized 2Fe-2S/4Fe-4S cluster protein (DUF4445 family)